MCCAPVQTLPGAAGPFGENVCSSTLRGVQRGRRLRDMHATRIPTLLLVSLLKPEASRSQVQATGWAASKAKLLDEACSRAKGHCRSLAHEQRWGKLLVKVLQGVGSEQFCMLAQDLVEPKSLLELSLHPHGSQVLRAILKQLALLLALPEMAVRCTMASSSRQALCNLLQSLYAAAKGNLAYRSFFLRCDSCDCVRKIVMSVVYGRNALARRCVAAAPCGHSWLLLFLRTVLSCRWL